MNIINRNTTDWRTEDLEELFRAACEYRGVQPEQFGTIRVEHSKCASWRSEQWKYSGRCWHRSQDIYFGVPKPEDTEDGFDAERFSQVVLHEIDHLCQPDITHREMIDWWTLPAPFVNGHKVRLDENL